MGVEFDFSDGLGIARRTRACEVCHTVLLADYPPATACSDCGAPLCRACVPDHRCLSEEQRARLVARQTNFYERMTGGR